MRSLLNVADEHDFILVVAWLLAALHSGIPKPVMAIRGGEGSAKSTLMAILRGLIDPHDPPYTALPQTDLKLRAVAADSYVQAYDNISGLTVPMSDALCRFVTGGRNQPVIINGVSNIITRAELADRCVFIDCAPIPDAQRRPHAEVMTTFVSQRPPILGALLDAVAHGLRNLDQTKPTTLPRMADFALAVAACETMFWPSGTFKTAYDANRADVVEALVESDPVASAVRLLANSREAWEGQASDLDNILQALTGHLEGAKNWPADPRILANRLRALAPSLMKTGIDVRFHKSRDHDRKRLITITTISPDAAIEEDALLASAASEKPSGHKEAHTDAGGDNGASAITNTTPNQSPASAVADAADAADADEAEEVDPPQATPDVADAEIKDMSVQFVDHRIIGGKRIEVFRRRTHRKAKMAVLPRRPE